MTNQLNIKKEKINYIQKYLPLIDYIKQCDITNITNGIPKNIIQNRETLVTLLLIKKYAESFLLNPALCTGYTITFEAGNSAGNRKPDLGCEIVCEPALL